MWILPGDLAGSIELDILDFADKAFRARLIQVEELPSFAAYGVDDGCVRTATWA